MVEKVKICQVPVKFFSAADFTRSHYLDEINLFDNSAPLTHNKEGRFPTHCIGDVYPSLI